MKLLTLNHAVCFLLITISSFPATAGIVPQSIYYNVKDYGAKGDGVTADTKMINAAIEAASVAGGGTVYFPAGKYLSGSLHLASNITLYIDQGAVIVAADGNGTDYDKPEPSINDKYQDFGHSHFHNSLIWGEHLHDISITGGGMIYGKGLVRSNKEGSDLPNKSIALLSCRNVIIRDVTIYHGGWFGILATGVDNLTIDNLKIDTQRDGMDIDCCQDVHISNCTVNSPGDDGICLKSSFALGYAKPSKDITITNCIVSGFDEGSVLDGTFKKGATKEPTGRIKFGTESNGGFQNITISNCVFDYCRGLALETVDGALLEDVIINNITMRDVTNAPVFIRLGARMRGPDSIKTGVCHRIIISNVVIHNALDNSTASIISGIPGHDIEDLELKNIRIYYMGGGTREMAQAKVSEYENNYPEPDKFGIIPAYGFFIRHVNGIKLSDVSLNFTNDEHRPAFVLNKVNDAQFSDIKVQKLQEVPAFSLDSVSEFSITNSRQFKNIWIQQVDHKAF